MKKYCITVAFIITVLAFQFCSPSKKLQRKQNSMAVANITYQLHIASVIQNSCSPCHISGKGKKEPLDNFTAATE